MYTMFFSPILNTKKKIEEEKNNILYDLFFTRLTL